MKKLISFLLTLFLIVGAGYAVYYYYYRTPVPTGQDDAAFSVLFLDVGQADAALVQCDGHWMLIDGGSADSSRKIYSVLNERGITHLDYVIASHPHEDHVGGLSAAFQNAEADLVLCSTVSYPDSRSFDSFSRYAAQKGNGIQVPKPGQRYSLGSAVVDILGVNAVPEDNDSSIIVRVTYGSTSFLFTGDAEALAENAVLQSGESLKASVLKVGHHGSSSGTTEAFLQAVSPTYAVISVGKGNAYGHPSESVLARLNRVCSHIYRTDLHSDILFTSDGTALSVSTDHIVSTTSIMTPGTYAVPTVPVAASEAILQDAFSFIANRNSKTFHLPSCTSVSQMKESNKWYYTGTRDELIAQGYKACGICHP